MVMKHLNLDKLLKYCINQTSIWICKTYRSY